MTLWRPARFSAAAVQALVLAAAATAAPAAHAGGAKAHPAAAHAKPAHAKPAKAHPAAAHATKPAKAHPAAAHVKPAHAKPAKARPAAAAAHVAPPHHAAETSAPPPGAVTPGVQRAPPGPPRPRPPPIEPRAKGRRAVRGCPVGMNCHDDLQAGMRAFELQAFPPPGARSPWIDPDDPDGDDRVRYFGGAGKNPVPRPPGASLASSRRVRRPSELYPNLPWLDKIQLPDLPITWTDRLVRYLEFYKDDPRGHAIMASWLRDQGRYRGLIVTALRKARLPRDLLYVAMIESSYDPRDYSRAGASGIWQFMRSAARIYGLHINHWLDERNDPVQSTRAAVIYFRDLYQRFGSWDLALAAYNAGYGAVLRAMAKYNTNDYWRLCQYENALPWGATLYVPKILAAAIVGENRKLFGFADVKPAAPVSWDLVTVPRSVSLRVIARAAGATLDDIKALNPQLRRGRTPPQIKHYAVRVPAGHARLFAERFPQLRGEWDKYDAYVVSSGERFEDIATTFGISTARLRALNHLKSQAEVHGGMVLVVPKVSAAERAKNRALAQENLYESGVPKADPNEKLLVPVPDPTFSIKGKKRVFYRVVSGNTLWGVAHAFHVDRRALAEYNGLDPGAHLQARMVLEVWVDPSFDARAAHIKLLDPARITVVKAGSEDHLDRVEERLGRARVHYQAKKQESLARVGRKYGLSASDLARINHIPQDSVLAPGQRIIVYAVVDPHQSDRARAQARRARRNRARSRRRHRRHRRSGRHHHHR